MRFFIPTIGTKIILDANHKFSVQSESRNNKIIRASSGKDPVLSSEYWKMIRDHHRREPTKEEWKVFHDLRYPLELPEGTKLTVDRIYIRKGAVEFDSLSFTINDCPNKRFATKKNGGTYTGGLARFFVDLKQANTISFDIIDDV